MTAKQLIKALERMVAKHGNCKVGVDHASLKADSNGTYTIANVNEVVFDTIGQVDGDGFAIWNKDGTERMTRMLIIQ